MPAMRAKLRVGHVQQIPDGNGGINAENVTFFGVHKDKYDGTGLDENNTFAKFTPSARLDITISNPALFGAFRNGDTFYVDFTKAEQ